MKRSFFAVMAILMCVAILFSGCQKKPGGGSVSDNQENLMNIMSSNKIEVNGEDVTLEGTAGLCDEARLFVQSKYYLEGTIYSEGEEGYAMTLATDGTNIQLETETSGISVGFLLLDKKSYILHPGTNEYTELNKKFVDLLDIDISLDEFQNFEASEDEIKDASEKQTPVTINGKPGSCVTFDYPEVTIKLYVMDDKLIQVDYLDNTGKITTQIVVDKIDQTIPANMLTLKDKTKVSVTTFIKSITEGAIAAAQ